MAEITGPGLHREFQGLCARLAEQRTTPTRGGSQRADLSDTVEIRGWQGAAGEAQVTLSYVDTVRGSDGLTGERVFSADYEVREGVLRRRIYENTGTVNHGMRVQQLSEVDLKGPEPILVRHLEDTEGGPLCGDARHFLEEWHIVC